MILGPDCPFRAELAVPVEYILAMTGLVLSAIAILVSLSIHWRQHSFNKDLEKRQRLFQQRQLLLPLWDHLSNIREVDENSTLLQIVQTVNTLELVSLCEEAEVIDPKLIRRTFADRFIELYEAIQHWKSPDAPRAGIEVLRENPATQRLYRDLAHERQESGRLQGFGGK